MSKRRSRSLRPEKARSSEPPVPKVPAVHAADRAEDIAPEPAAAAPIDELAALDAGWDELLS